MAAKLPFSEEAEAIRDDEFLVIHEESDEDDIRKAGRRLSGEPRNLPNENYVGIELNVPEQQLLVSNDGAEIGLVDSGDEVAVDEQDEYSSANVDEQILLPLRSAAIAPPRRYTGLPTSEALSRLERNIHRNLEAYVEGTKLQWFWDAFNPVSAHAIFTWTGFAVILAEFLVVGVALIIGEFNKTLIPESEVIALLAMLFVFMMLNFGLNAWHAHARHFEMYRKAKSLEKRINYARRIGRWSLAFYESLDAPDSPCISLQWTFRDNCVVNLPSCMLVEGDVILVRPAQQVFARCQELNGDGSLGETVLDPKDVYLPKSATAVDASVSSVNGGGSSSLDGSSTVSIIRLIHPVTAAKFRVLQSPIHGILQQALNMHQPENPRPRSVFENERNKAWRFVERIVLPAAIALNLMVSFLRHFTEPHQQREPIVEQFVLSFVVVILPLTPLVFPVFYILANYVGLARVLSLLSRFRRKKHKIEMLAESRVTDTYFFAEVHWPTVWRKFKALVTGRDDESLHRTANFMQTLANVSAICCVDKKGILSWANPNAEKVFFIRNHHRDYNPSAILDVISAQLKAKLDYNALKQRIWSGARRDAARRVSIENSAPTMYNTTMLRLHKSTTNSRKHSNTPEYQRGVGAVLDLAQSGNEPFAIHFNGSSWRKHLDSLKPLGLAILLNTCVEDSTRFYRMFADHLAYVANSSYPSTSVSVLNRRCLCMLSQTIGFVPTEFHKHYRLVFRFGVYRKPPPDENQQHQRKQAAARATIYCADIDAVDVPGGGDEVFVENKTLFRQSVRKSRSNRPSSGTHYHQTTGGDIESAKPFIVGDDDSSPYQSVPLTPAHAVTSPLSPSAIATVVNETQEISGNYKNAVSLVDAVRLVAANRRRDSCQSDDNNSSLRNSKGRSHAPPLSPTTANDEEGTAFHSCRSSSISSATSTPSKQALLIDGDEDADDEVESVRSAAGSHSYNMQAAEQVYKTPFPNCYVTVVQDRLSGLCHVVVQGTGDMLADIVTYYWNGVEMKMFTESDRVRIRDFYTRQSLTAFASAFAYKSLANAAKLANLLDERCSANVGGVTNTSGGQSSKGDLIFELPNVQTSSSSSYMEQILRGTRSSSNDSGGVSALDADILEACLSELIFVGASMFQYQSRNSFVHTIELLQQGCIRFIHFSRENELRSRAFAERLGLESGWNCHVCLDSQAVDPHAATTLLEHEESAKPTGGGVSFPATTAIDIQRTSSSPPSSPINAGAPTATKQHNRLRRSTNVSKVSNVSDLQPPPHQQRQSSVTSSNTHRTSARQQHAISTAKQVVMSPAGNATTSFSMNPKGVVGHVVRSPGGDSISISESTSAQDSTDQNVMPNFDWYNRSGLPKGIENIREHLEKIDNVPLLVPLFTDCKQTSAQEMIKIMQENGEVVCTIGSAASQWNASVFSQSDSAVAIEPLHAEHCAVRAYMMSAGGAMGNGENDDMFLNEVDDEIRIGDMKRKSKQPPAARQVGLRHRLSNVRWSRSHEIPMFINQSGGNSQNASSAQLNATSNTTPVHRVNYTPSSAAGGATSAASKLQPRTRQRNRQQQQSQPQPIHKRITQGMLRGGGGSSVSLGASKGAMLMKERHRRSGGNNLTGQDVAVDNKAANSSRRSSVDPTSTSSKATGAVNRRVSMITGGLTAKPSALRSPFRKHSKQPSFSSYQHLEQHQRIPSTTTASPRYAEQARQMMKRKLQALHLPTASTARRSHHHLRYNYQNLLNRGGETNGAAPKKTSHYDSNDAFLTSAASRDLRTSPQDIANHINSLNCALKLHADEPFCLITLIMQSRHFMNVLRNCLLFMASCQLFLFLTILLSRLALMPYPLSLGQLMFIIFIIIPLLCAGIMASPQERQQMKYPTSKNQNLMRWPVIRRYLSSFARRWLPSLCVCCLLFVLLCLQHCRPTYDAVYDETEEAAMRENRSAVDVNWKRNLSSSSAASNNTARSNLPFFAYNASGSFASCYPRLANIQSADIVVSAAQLIVFFEICMCFVVNSASYLNPHHTIFGRSPFRNRWWLFCAVVAIGLNVLFVIGDQGLYMLRSSSDGFGVGELVWSDAWQEQASLGHDRKVALAIQILIWSVTCIWPFVLLVVNEMFKKQDIVRHEKRQKRARLQFNTKLGQYSPV